MMEPDLLAHYNPLHDPAAWISVLFAILCARRAQRFGRSGWLWGFLGLCFGPLAYLGLTLLTRRLALAEGQKGYSQGAWGKNGAQQSTPSPSNQHCEDLHQSEWYYVDARREAVGPLKREDLLNQIGALEQPSSTLVWHPALTDWTAAEQVDSLLEEKKG